METHKDNQDSSCGQPTSTGDSSSSIKQAHRLQTVVSDTNNKRVGMQCEVY